ncbi:MAG: S41 family peptidase [Fimbriimonadaceae bacterium]|nr:S41 family peptidase [Fimbriimonadaceae bacterium]
MSAKVFLTIGVSALIAGAMGFGWRDLQNRQAPDSRAVGKLFGVRTTTGMTPEKVFQNSYNQIRERYSGAVKPEDLRFAGMQGMMSSLGDPHTLFLPPRAAQAFSEETSGNFYGVGARLSEDPLGARAVSVFEDGPAYASGIRANDVIIEVDGKKVGGLPTDAIVTRIKGKEGTPVRLTIMRTGVPQPKTYTIRRARIVTPSVEGKFFEDSKVGYLMVTHFSEPTAMQFDRELAKIDRRTPKGLVIDLRSNPGGLLDAAADMLSRFVANKVVVTMKGRGGFEEVVRTSPNATRDWPYPVVVLIDENSASASEIFAGVLRDYNKATLVGTHSYGKSSVQNVFPLVDRSSAKVTIAKYFLPNGEDIGRKVDADGAYLDGGLKPNVKVELDLNKEPEFGNPKSDNQLQKAIEVLLSKAD